MKKYQRRIGGVLAVFMLCAATLTAARPDTAQAAEADSEPQTYHAAVELRDGTVCNYVDYSSFDGIHVATLEGSVVNQGEITVNLKPTATDWTGARYVYVRTENVNHCGTLMAVKIADAGGNVFSMTNTAFVSQVGEAATGSNGVQSILNTGFSGYARLDLSQLQQVAGEGGALDTSNIAAMQFTYYYNQKNKLNLGDIYIEKEDGTVEQVLAAKDLTEGSGAGQYSAEYLTYDPGAIPLENLKQAARAVKIRANEVIVYPNSENQWQAFFACIPGDISGYNGISFYIDNTLSDGAWFSNKCIRENSVNGIMEHWFIDGTSPFATFYPDGGESYVGNANVIPAGFRGTVVIPFSGLTQRNQANIVENGVFNPENLFPRIEFTTDTASAAYSSRNFIIKDIQLVGDAVQFADTVQKPFTLGDMKIVNPFDYVDDFDLSSDWNIQWTLSADADISVADNPAKDVPGVSDRAMKIVCGAKTTVADANQDTCIQWSLNAEQGDAKGARGITYWIKNTSYTQIGFRVEFDSVVSIDGVGNSQRWQSLPNCRYLLINTVTGEETVCMGKGGVYIPKGFEGYVRIPFSQFARPNWVTIGNDFTTDNPIGTAYIIMNSTYHQGDSFLFDSLGFYYTDVEPTTTFHTPDNSFTNAMNGDYFAQ